MAGFGDAFKSAMAKADAAAQRAAGAVATGAKWVGKQTETAAAFSKSAVNKVDDWVADQVKKAVQTTGDVIDTAGAAAMTATRHLPASWQAPAETVIAGGVGIATMATEVTGKVAAQAVNAAVGKINTAIDGVNAKVQEAVKDTVVTAEKVHKVYQAISKAATDKGVAAAKAICETAEAAKERLRKRYEEGLQNAAARRLNNLGTGWETNVAGGLGYERDGRKYISTNPNERGVAKQGEGSTKLGISREKREELLYYGDDDSNIIVSGNETKYLAGYKKTKDGAELGLSASKTYRKVQATWKSDDDTFQADGGLEVGTAEVAATVGLLKGPDKLGVKGDLGGEINLIKGEALGRVNITPATVYHHTLGRVLGAVNPKLADLPDNKYLKKGLYIGGKAEGGVGAAAKAAGSIDLKAMKIDGSLKLGAGLFGGISIATGVIK